MSREQAPNDKEMGFFDHLEELRGIIMRSLAAALIMAVVVFLFKDFVFKYIIFGPLLDNFLTYNLACKFSHFAGMGDKLCMSMTLPEGFTFQAIGMGEAFLIHFKVSFILGLVVAFPYIFSQVWAFIRPALYDTERKRTSGIIFVCSFLFLLGVSFGYFVVAPFAINFLLNYAVPMTSNVPTAASYLNFMIMFTLPTGLVFELPIVVYFLSKLGIVTDTGMRGFRRYAVVIILLVAAIITPSPDAVSQLIVGVPLYILYELSIFIARYQTRRRMKGLED